MSDGASGVSESAEGRAHLAIESAVASAYSAAYRSAEEWHREQMRAEERLATSAEAHGHFDTTAEYEGDANIHRKSAAHFAREAEESK